jgi:pyruvate/2-oxoglutarate dehydrogenase complex dihydrolipoamide acyltransferase (E2) component
MAASTPLAPTPEATPYGMRAAHTPADAESSDDDTPPPPQYSSAEPANARGIDEDTPMPNAEARVTPAAAAASSLATPALRGRKRKHRSDYSAYHSTWQIIISLFIY